MRRFAPPGLLWAERSFSPQKCRAERRDHGLLRRNRDGVATMFEMFSKLAVGAFEFAGDGVEQIAQLDQPPPTDAIALPLRKVGIRFALVGAYLTSKRRTRQPQRAYWAWRRFRP